MVRDTPTGVELAVRVIPRAKVSAAAGVREGMLLVRVAAPPVDDAANEALVAFLAGWLDVPRRSVRIVSGTRSRRKRVAVAGIRSGQVRARLSR